MRLRLSKRERQAVEDFKDALVKKLEDKLVLVRLFGSKVRGLQRKGSDIDILVVYKGKNGEMCKKLADIEWDILKRYNFSVYISAIPYTLKEFEEDEFLQTPFIYNVDKEGLTIWSTDLIKKS